MGYSFWLAARSADERWIDVEIYRSVLLLSSTFEQFQQKVVHHYPQ